MKRLFWNACTDNAADKVLRCLTKRDSGVRTGDVKMNGIEGVASGFAVIADCDGRHVARRSAQVLLSDVFTFSVAETRHSYGRI